MVKIATCTCKWHIMLLWFHEWISPLDVTKDSDKQQSPNPLSPLFWGQNYGASAPLNSIHTIEANEPYSWIKTTSWIKSYTILNQCKIFASIFFVTWKPVFLLVHIMWKISVSPIIYESEFDFIEKFRNLTHIQKLTRELS